MQRTLTETNMCFERSGNTDQKKSGNMSGKDARFYFKKVILCNYKKNLKAMNLFRLFHFRFIFSINLITL